MTSNNGEKKKRLQVLVGFKDGEMDTLDAVIEMVVKQSNGRAEPTKSDIIRELMGFRPERLVRAEEREFVRKRMEAGHPRLSMEPEEKATA